ncbi:YbhN family protein [Agrilactobacillus yilanensis]|uniref:Phosphatidylglycerol lysyltransferase n=1 Tax=Agrilactobacillus yilanensis TaxID=2485997 RepID=A0ABW4JAN7_9LACO|nr:lysylphosphatidylglycerol synthase transmembrane domain-containing protein [Agrilactobacillus yilanensis]
MTRKNKFILVIMLLIGGLIFWWEARKIPFTTLINSFQSLKVGWLVVAVLVMITSLLIESKTVQVFLKGRVAYFPYRNAVRIPMVEQLFNNITPFSSGGQPAQLIAMMQSGVEAGQASSVLLMKFIIYQMMVLINFVLTMLFGFRHIASQFKGIALLVVAGFALHVFVIIGLLLVMYRYKFTKRLVQWFAVPFSWFAKPAKVEKFKVTMDAKIDTFYAESLHLKREKKKVIIASGLTLLQLLLYYSIPVFVLLALGETHINPLSVMAMHVMIVMITSIFPVPGGTGGAEYSFKTLFAVFLTTQGNLVVGMLLWRLITYYLGMLLGLIALTIPAKKPPIAAIKINTHKKTE